MKVLITGGSGLIGWSVLNRLAADHEVWYTYFRNDVEHPEATGSCLDIQNRKAVFDQISSVEPDVVIHSAAMTDVDVCETNPKQAHSINVDGTKHVLDAAADIGASVVFLSTAFVFDGEKNQYQPSDERNPVNEYGVTKHKAEIKVENADIETVIVRTDQPYGKVESWQSATMIQWTLNQLATDTPVTVFEDWYNNPTYLPDIPKVIETLIHGTYTETFHVVGPDYVNRYSWAKSIADAFGHDCSHIIPSRSESVTLPAKRPNVCLDNTGVTTKISQSMTGLDAGIKSVTDI